MKRSILSAAFFLLASSTAFPMYPSIGGYATSHGPIGGGMGMPGGHHGNGGGSHGGGPLGAGPYDNPAQGPSVPGGYGGNYGGGGHSGGVNDGNRGNTTGDRIGPKYGTRIPNAWRPKGKRTAIPPRDPVGGRGGYGIPTEEQKRWMDEDDARIKRENDALDEIEYKYETLMQAEKDQLPEMRALLAQSEAIIIQRSQLSEPKETTFERLRKKALAVQNVKLARDSQEQVKQLVIQANETLPRVMPQMEQASSDFIRQQLQLSQTVAQNAVDVAQNGASKNIVKLLSDFALDTATTVNAFVGGVANGVYDGFMTPIQVARAIYNNPTLITNLSANIMNTVTAGPGAAAEVVHGAFQHVSNAVYQFETIMAYGTAEQRGHAFGELGANVILGMAGGEAAVAARTALEGAAAAMAEAGATEALGTALNQGIRASEALAPELRGIEESVAALDQQSGHAVRGWRAHHRIGRIEAAEAANERHLGGNPDFHPPYQADTQVIHFTPTRPDEYVRVHTMRRENAHLGSWMMKKEAIRGMTPEEIQIKYALPEAPTHITDVTVPVDHPMTRGKVRDILQELQRDRPTVLPEDLHTPEGAVQYRAERHLAPESFTNTREIGERIE